MTANTQIKELESGGGTDCVSLTAALADGNFGGGSNEWDNSYGWPLIQATLRCQDTFSAAPAANSVVRLWMVKKDVTGTKDEDAPSGTDSKGAHLVGQFTLDDADTDQARQIIVSSQMADKADFYIEPDTGGASISYSTNPIKVNIKGCSLIPSSS